MQTKTYVEKTYVLELTEQEAIWLRGLMQNPFNGDTPEEELEQDKEMRFKFFSAVEEAGRNGGR